MRPSATGAVLARATELRRQGFDVISLGAGEPDFETPEAIRQAAVEAIENGVTRYTPIDGTASLKAAIRDKFLRENGLDYPAEQILVSSGAKQSLFNLCIALLGPGDEAVVPAPYWVSYPEMVRLADAAPVVIDTGIEAGFKVTPEQLEASLGPQSRLLFLNTPSNPTGACYSARELAALGEVLQAWPDVVIAADDIYEHIYWADEPFTSFAAACPKLVDRTVTINGVSKAYAMTGWRIGYAAGPVELIRAMQTVQSQSTSNACSVSQAAAEAALLGDQSVVAGMTAEYKRRHDWIVAALNELPGVECRPGEGAFYVFPRVRGALHRLGLPDSVALAEHLLAKARVASVPGTAFGAPEYLRISFACSMENLEEAVGRIKHVLSA